MNHIELFAGCGGLSLGLETAGFELLVANELSPMASETFAYNHLNTDLGAEEDTEKVFWVSSQYPRDCIQDRLRENPYEAAGLQSHHHSDLIKSKPTVEQLRRSLLVGSIVDINKILAKRDSWLLKSLKSGLGSGVVDLVSGGPPCQSFSLYGMRDHTHHRNQLPWEFAHFIKMVKPKIALLENVSGILRPFKVDGDRFYAWFEVAKAFAEVGYVPLCLNVNAKHVGTAQNRTRFIMIALRLDMYRGIVRAKTNQSLIDLLKPSAELHRRVKRGEDPAYGSLPYYDLAKRPEMFINSVLSPLLSHVNDLTSVKDAIDDLRSTLIKESGYVNLINSDYLNYHGHELGKWVNQDHRSNTSRVRARFRLYQIMSRLSQPQAKQVSQYLKSEGETEISADTLDSVRKSWMLDTDGVKLSNPTRNQLLKILDHLYTKKHTQRALLADEPAPTALSIPDDACHYHESEGLQRTLTVREMARIQSFPDWYQIKSKVTTGGKMRRYEVPQYTQIGNAVPPLLGVALGKVCRRILESLN